MDAGTTFSARHNVEEDGAGENKPVYCLPPFPQKLEIKYPRLKSRATVLLRMIRHATELYHSNYIRNKFTIWKKKKDYKKQSTKTAAVSQLRDMQRREMHYMGAAENEFNVERATCC